MVKVHSFNRYINETDIDTFGHVNHATYLVLCEEARWEWVRSKGITLSYIKENQKGFAVLNAELKYLRELPANIHIKIDTFLTEFKGKYLKVFQQISSEESVFHAEVYITIGLFDLQNRRLFKADSFWESALDIDLFLENK